jgi:hypothetical protein
MKKGEPIHYLLFAEGHTMIYKRIKEVPAELKHRRASNQDLYHYFNDAIRTNHNTFEGVNNSWLSRFGQDYAF